MATEIDERVPRGGHSLMTVFGIPGAVLGFFFYLVLENLDQIDVQERFMVAALVGISLGSATYFLTVLRGQVIRASVTGLLMAIAAGALGFLAYDGQAFDLSSGFMPVLAWGTVLVVSLPFIRTATKGNSFFDYRPLYADAWTLPAIVGVSQLFVLVGVLLAFLVAALFAFIGLSFLSDLMREGWFMSAYGGLLQAVGIGVVRQREAAILAVRGIKMALIRVTAPVFAACAALFVGAVMIRGFGSLLDGLSPVATLTATAFVAIIMINAIVADEGRPQNILFGATARLLGVVLLFLMALAVYGLFMRVSAEGWTPNRIAAALAVGVAAAYAPIYAAAALAERWSILRQGNIAMSAVLLLLAIFICTPLFRPYDWSVSSQLEKFEREPEAVKLVDLAYLRDQLGEPGRLAFEDIRTSSGPLTAKAESVGERPMYELRNEERPMEEVTVTVVPADAEISGSLREFGLAQVGASDEIIFYPMTDGRVILAVVGSYVVELFIIEEEGGTWRIVYDESLYSDTREEVLAAIRAGDVSFETRTYALPKIGNRVFPSGAYRFEPFRVEEEDLGEAEDPAN